MNYAGLRAEDRGGLDIDDRPDSIAGVEINDRQVDLVEGTPRRDEPVKVQAPGSPKLEVAGMSRCAFDDP